MGKVFRNFAAHKTGILLAEFGGAQAEIALKTRWKPAGSTIRFESNLVEPSALPAADELRFQLKPYEVRVLCVDGE